MMTFFKCTLQAELRKNVLSSLRRDFMYFNGKVGEKGPTTTTNHHQREQGNKRPNEEEEEQREVED